MTAIRIDTGIVREATAAFSASTGCLDELIASLSSARSAAAPMAGASQGLNGQLQQAFQLVSEIERDVKQLTSTVRSIADDYENTEAESTHLFQ